MGRGHGHVQASPQETGGKTNRSRLSPRWVLYHGLFLPTTMLQLPAWSYPPPPLLGVGGLLSRGYISGGGVGRKGEALEQSGSPVASAPQRGERRKDEGSTELGLKYSRSYTIEDKSNTLWGSGVWRKQGQIPPPRRGRATPGWGGRGEGEGRDWKEKKNLGRGGAQGLSHPDPDS